MSQERIVAVIPARAGSKGIPNKNMRMVQGYPLVYYSINNALKSKRISHVIVTTDSSSIAMIASRMGAEVRWRKKELCEDDVTLDAVICDAVDIPAWDVVVTMQPTSPTLRPESVDSAIDKLINEKLDTVLSAVNRPHLTWGEKDGRPVPNYEKRLNRQYLPANYMETGGFVVSRAELLSRGIRIGEKVSVFCLSEEEAIDIDSYIDLETAVHILEKKKVAIYVNGNTEIGLGHVYRALEVADEFFCPIDILYDSMKTDPKIFGESMHRIIATVGEKGLLERCESQGYSLFINDILSTDVAYMNKLRRALPDARIINFEDDGEGAELADLVINALYSNAVDTHMCVGEKYFIIAKPFMFYGNIEIAERVKKVLISFGGADPQAYTDRLMKIISQKDYEDYEFVVVLGRSKKNASEMMSYDDGKHIRVLHDVSNMPEIMSECDVAVTSRGRTAYELAMLGIPTMAIAQNETEEKHGFVCEENGFIYMGMNPKDDVISDNLRSLITSDQGYRKGLQDKMLRHDLRHGRENVMAMIKNL